MAGAGVAGGAVQRVQKALEAGCDLVLLCNAPAEVPAVLAALRGYVNPGAQLRLSRLHGGRTTGWDALRESAAWQSARAAVEALRARPSLELEG